MIMYSMVPDKNRAVFIRTSGSIPPVLIFVDHVFLFLHPVIFIHTMFFTSISLWFLFRLHYFKMLHKNCYCNKSFKAGPYPCGFNLDSVFHIVSHDVFIRSNVSTFLPLRFLFRQWF